MTITNLSVTAPDVALIAELQNPSQIIALTANTPAASVLTADIVSQTSYATLADAFTAAVALQADFDGTAIFGNLISSTNDITYSNESSTDVTANIGDAVTIGLSAAINLGSISYQWYKNGQIIPDAEDSNLSTGSFQSGQAGQYTLEITIEHPSTGRIAATTRVYNLSETPAAAPALTSAASLGIAAVDTLTVNNAGTGYTADSTDVATTGGSGTGLTVDITTDGDAILTATVNFPGENYVDGETVTVSGDGNGDATLDITVN